jgi:(R)-amidase
MITLELAQLSLHDGDISGNLEKALSAINNASHKTDIIMFPETYFSGFPNKDNIEDLSQTIDGKIIQTLIQASKEKNIAVVAGFSEKREGQFYNSSVFISPEEGLLACYSKTHMWLTDKDLFTPGERFISFKWREIRIGLLICFDIEFPESGRANAQLDVDLLLVTNGNMDPYGDTHRTAIKARAQENQFYAAFVNRVGEDSLGHIFAGGSCVVNPFGELLCEAGREENIQIISIDPLSRHAYKKEYDYLNESAIKYTPNISKTENLYELRINK